MCKILYQFTHRHFSLKYCNPRLYCSAVSYACSPIPLPRYIDRSKNVPKKSGSELREEFIKFFKDKHNHTLIPGSSMLPKPGDGTYFTNAGMNQFKSIFLSPEGNASIKRAVNSQRCARIGGKLNDLEDVGFDSFHHTYFEMLGNWSFADYGKAEVCSMMWQFLTQVLKLPPENLYITYFEGCKELGLPPDNETRDIWLKLGVSDQRILRGNMKDNFWEMGEVGPCGPSSEIHFDHVGGGRCARCFVNSGSPEVVELWNAVFIQYNRINSRQEAGSLQPLQSGRLFIDTGMGLERLASVVQGVTSNYDCDLISPIIDRLSSLAVVPPYSGTIPLDAFKKAKIDHLERFSPLGNVPKPPELPIISESQISRDISYRIVADHLRFVCATVADGLLPGLKENEKRLRHVLHRLLYHSHAKLGIPAGRLHQEVDFIIELMNIQTTGLASLIPTVIVNEEEKFLPQLEGIVNTFNKHTQNINQGDALSEEQVIKLTEGQSPKHAINFDLLSALCRDRGLAQPPLPQYLIKRELENRAKQRQHTEQRQEMKDLLKSCVNSAVTDDSHKYDYTRQADGSYHFSSPNCEIRTIIVNNNLESSLPPNTRASILLDQTSFYAEAGGQISDCGFLINGMGEAVFRVDSVENLSGYILHHGQSLNVPLKTNESILAKIDPEHRLGLMQHHTAHHLFLHSLSETIGHKMRTNQSAVNSLSNLQLVSQRGSQIGHNKFLIQVSCLQPLDSELLAEVEAKCRSYIDRCLPIHRIVRNFDEIKDCDGIRRLNNDDYPPAVNVISIGEEMLSVERTIDWPIEVCGGTHVLNTEDLKDIIVIAVDGAKQPVKEICCIAGQAASTARSAALALTIRLDELKNRIDTFDESQINDVKKEFDSINKDLSQITHKITRDSIPTKFIDLKRQFALLFSDWHSAKLSESIKNVLAEADKYRQSICVPFDISSPKRLMRCIAEAKPHCPLLLWDSNYLLCYIPRECTGTSIIYHDKLVKLLLEKHDFPMKTSSSNQYTADTTLFFLLKPSNSRRSIRNLVDKELCESDEEITHLLDNLFQRIVTES